MGESRKKVQVNHIDLPASNSLPSVAAKSCFVCCCSRLFWLWASASSSRTATTKTTMLLLNQRRRWYQPHLGCANERLAQVKPAGVPPPDYSKFEPPADYKPPPPAKSKIVTTESEIRKMRVKQLRKFLYDRDVTCKVQPSPTALSRPEVSRGAGMRWEGRFR